jgi:MIP family channel proteins
MRDAVRHFLAEFLGTFALVFVGSTAIIMVQQGISNLLGVAVAHGLILAVMTTATMRVSAHFNPAVTVGFLVTRRIQPTMAVLYLVAQLLGAMIAAYVVKLSLPPDVFAAARGATLSISSSIQGGQAFLLEAIATFILVFAVFGTAVDPQAPRVGGFAIGLTVTADILAIGPLTGASMNPARSFGPAVASGVYEAQIIYWTAPVVGAVLAAVLYDVLFLRHGIEPVEHGAVRPKA